MIPLRGTGCPALEVCGSVWLQVCENLSASASEVPASQSLDTTPGYFTLLNVVFYLKHLTNTDGWLLSLLSVSSSSLPYQKVTFAHVIAKLTKLLPHLKMFFSLVGVECICQPAALTLSDIPRCHQENF